MSAVYHVETDVSFTFQFIINTVLSNRGVPDSGLHLVPARFGTILFGPELLDLDPTGSESVPPKNRLMWITKGTIQKVKILNMLFICRASLLSNSAIRHCRIWDRKIAVCSTVTSFCCY